MILIIGTTEKIDQLASVVAGMNTGSGPDVLGVCEVGNRFLVDRLVVPSTLVTIQSHSPLRGMGKPVNQTDSPTTSQSRSESPRSTRPAR